MDGERSGMGEFSPIYCLGFSFLVIIVVIVVISRHPNFLEIFVPVAKANTS